MLTIEAPGDDVADPDGEAAGSPVAAAVGTSEAIASEAAGVGDSAGDGDAGGRLRVGWGLEEPVGTGVAAGGVAPTPVTAGVGVSAPGVGKGDEGAGVLVTRASRGTENAYRASRLTRTADVPLCWRRTADGFTVRATSVRVPPPSVPHAEASSPGQTRSMGALART
jgi:hypothetical protein